MSMPHLTTNGGLISNLTDVLRKLVKDIEQNTEISQDNPAVVDLKAYLICAIFDLDLRGCSDLQAGFPRIGPID